MSGRTLFIVGMTLVPFLTMAVVTLVNRSEMEWEVWLWLVTITGGMMVAWGGMAHSMWPRRQD